MTTLDPGVSETECPVCFSVECTARPFPGAHDVTEYSCPRCGNFALTGSAAAVLPHQLESQPIRRALTSHKLRRMHQAERKTVWVHSYALDALWIEARLPTPQQQADGLVLWIGDNQASSDAFAHARSAFIAAWIGANVPRVGNPSETGLSWLYDQLKPQNLFVRWLAGNIVVGVLFFVSRVLSSLDILNRWWV
jgi:hypothetical protein